MELTHPSPRSLHAGLALLAAAPPAVDTVLSRGERLRLQARLLADLPGFCPGAHFCIYWRQVWSWGAAARVATGVVEWSGRRAAFAVDPDWCTLVAAHVPEALILAHHLARRVTDDTAA